MDGHTGTGCHKVNEGGSDPFQLILAVLKQASGQSYFVIHATSNALGRQPPTFLQKIGFEHFRGECCFHHDLCFWRVIAEWKEDYGDIEHWSKTNAVHRAFESFANKIGEVYTLWQRQEGILNNLRLKAPAPSIFGEPVRIEIDPSEIPVWAETIKFQKLKDLEKNAREINEEIKELRGYLPLLYGDDDILRDAVIKALEFLGLEAKPTEKGFTVDILARTEDEAMRFGFEVTGTGEAIKKASRKLTQVLEFERTKEHNEKTVLLANTYKNIPIEEREGKEDFTEPVVEFLGKHPILLMTGWDLYRMVKDVMKQQVDRQELVKILHEKEGVLNY